MVEPATGEFGVWARATGRSLHLFLMWPWGGQGCSLREEDLSAGLAG